MKAARGLLGLSMVLSAIVALVAALAMTRALLGSTIDFGAHHEVTLVLCRFIALTAFSLGAALTAGRLIGGRDMLEALSPLAHFAGVALVGWGAELVFANETFFSLYDPKGFPVHLTEPVLFPAAGWHGMASHLLGAVLLTGAFAFLWWTLRKATAACDTN